MSNTIKLKRGPKSTLPIGAEGEPLFTTDTSELFIGNGTDNIKVLVESSVLNDLFDVNISIASDGQILRYENSTSKWKNVDLPVTSPAGSNTEIQYNNSGSFGASSDLAYTTGTNVHSLKVGSGYLRVFNDGTTKKNIALGIGNISSIDTTAATGNIILSASANSSLTTGFENILLGGGSSITSGASNVFIGSFAGNLVNTYNQNVAVGYSSLSGAAGGGNVAVGTLAGNSTSSLTKEGNVYIGGGAGYKKYGSKNVYIGYEAGKVSSNTSESDKLYIANGDTTSPLIYGEFNNSTPSSQILKVNGKLESTEVFKQKTFSQTTQPTTTDIPDGYSAYWVDTDDSNRTYLCFNQGGTIKKVELT